MAKSLPERIARLARQGIEWLPNRCYDHRHPGLVARSLIAALAPAISRLTPNDKWSLGAHIPAWLRALDIAPVQPSPAPKRIFLFSAYRIQFTHDFIFAILLAWRGHSITIGYLPKLQSPIKEPLIDHPSAKPYLRAVLSRVNVWSRGRISCVDLTDLVVEKFPIDEDKLRAQVLSDTIMCVRRETLDMTDPAIAKAWAYYERQARDSYDLAMTYLSSHRNDFDLVLVANGATFETAQVCQAARTLGLPVNTFEKFDFRNVRVLNHGDHFLTFNDLDRLWKRRRELGYCDEPFRSFAVGRGMALMNERRHGSTRNWGWALQKSPNEDSYETLRLAGVDDGRPFVLVCTNVPYDAGYDTLLGKFPSMHEWLLQTVRFLLERTDIHVVVRAHPGEAASYGGKERSETTLAEFLGHERLTMISGDQTANTYNLIENCKFGVVFSSTTGVEMAMLGKTPLVGATVYYGGRGFTIDSATREEYFERLHRYATSATVPEMDVEASKEAALFHFIFHFVLQWPFPYHKPSSVREVPLPQLIRSGRVARYIPFIDAMACSQDEWEQIQGDYLAATANNHIPKPASTAEEPVGVQSRVA